MRDNKIIKYWRDACARQALITISIFILFAVAFLILVVLAILLPIPESQRVYILPIGLLIFLILMIIGVSGWGLSSIKMRARNLDRAFLPLGLTSKAYLWNGRQYHGIFNGRVFDAYFYRGPSLDIYIASPLITRLNIGLKGDINRIGSDAINLHELITTDPDLKHLGVYPLDQSWAMELLETTSAKSIILRLTTTTSKLELRNLRFQPESIQLQILHINPSTITTENLRAWVYGLQELSEIAESLPAPKITAVTSSMERKARLNRDEFTLPILGVTCAIIGFISLILIIITIVLLILGKGGY